MKLSCIGTPEFCEATTRYFASRDIQVISFPNDQFDPEKVVVGKAHLESQETLDNRSRMLDTFHISFPMTPDHNAIESFEVDEKVKDHLSQVFHSYMESDGVISQNETKPLHAGPGGRPVPGELAPHKSFHYQLIAPSEDIQEILVITNPEHVHEVLSFYENWIYKNTNHKLFISTTAQFPFTDQETAKLYEKLRDNLSKEIEKFESDLKKWHELEDFEKVKVTKPEAPIPQINLFCGHTALALDRLIDQNKLYATLEIPDFKTQVELQKENSLRPVKTLAVDRIVILKGTKEVCPHQTYLDKDEPGFYRVSKEILEPDTLETDSFEQEMAKIESDLLKYFKYEG